MTTNTTGAELKAFYQDPAFWPEAAYHDDEEIVIDGRSKSCDDDIMNIPDAASVTVSNGVVLDLPGYTADNAPSFESHFKRWRKLQSTASLVVECPKDKLDAVKAAIIAAGGVVK